MNMGRYGPPPPCARRPPSVVRRIAISICSRNQRARVVSVVGRSPPATRARPSHERIAMSRLIYVHTRPPLYHYHVRVFRHDDSRGGAPDFRPNSRPRAPRHMAAGGRRGPQGHKAQRWNRPRRPSSRRGWESEGEGGRGRGGLMYCFVEGDGEA